MESKSVKIKLVANPHQYRIEVGNEILRESGLRARGILSEDTNKIALISNQKVFDLYGKLVSESFEKNGFKVKTFLIGDGEEYKSLATLGATLEFLGRNEIKRTDAVIALGGGVVGDLAGFAASVYLRGIPLLQIPTTLLSMIDSSVGGKTAVNTEFGKNLVGTFYQPKGVLVDIATLRTLENREVVAGFCEAIKQGAIGNRELFDKTAKFLKQFPVKKFNRHFDNDSFLKSIQNLLSEQVKFKAQIVAQDEKESSRRTDSNSRKILNFGHTTAHALEKVTDYKYFKHGEAVGYGILVAAEISKKLDICDEDSINLLNDVVGLVGKLPETKNIEIDKILESFIFDKKAIGQSLQWILLESIGKPTILQSQFIPESIIKESIIKILKG
jgi:3-dehydroquinate synthase